MPTFAPGEEPGDHDERGSRLEPWQEVAILAGALVLMVAIAAAVVAICT